MRVGFYLADQNPQRDRTLGVTGYTDGLLRALQRHREIELAGLVSKGSFAPTSLAQRQTLPFSTAGAIGRILSDNFHPAVSHLQADVWHYPKGHLPVVRRFAAPCIGTVHDVILQHYADHYPGERPALAYTYWLGVLKRSIARFDSILTISQFSAQAIRKFCERHRLRCPPMEVTYEGFHVTRPPGTAAEKEDYVLHLASREPHKRTGTLLDFWRKLSSHEVNLPKLKLVGNLRPADARTAQANPRFELCGRLPRPELETAIARARAVVLPSEIEGFGLPAVEAYALGTPVVFVAETAVAEILGPQTPGSFQLESLESFHAALSEVLGLDAGTITQQAERLAQRYSWSACAEATVASYRKLAAG